MGASELINSSYDVLIEEVELGLIREEMRSLVKSLWPILYLYTLSSV